jgi:hypothetical protein
MSVRSIRLGLEELDARVLPSVALPIAVTPITTTPIISIPIITDPVPPITVVSGHHPLHGEGSASFVESTVHSVMGNQFTLTGSSLELRGLGKFTLSGSIYTDPATVSGDTTGQLILTNSKGTITVSLTGVPETGASLPPTKFTYTVTGGTGSYQKVSGSGKVQASYSLAPVAYGQPEQGIVQLKFTK